MPQIFQDAPKPSTYVEGGAPKRQKVAIFAVGLLVGLSLALGSTVGHEPSGALSETSSDFRSSDPFYGPAGMEVSESLASEASFSDPGQLRTLPILKEVYAAVVRVSTDTVSGSGVIISSTGEVLTSAHVVNGSKTATVVIGEGEPLIGTVTRVDTVRDLALVKLPPGVYSSAELGKESDIYFGTPVYVIGYPLNMGGPATVTAGVVSRYIDEPELGRKMIQTDAAINLGNSGGPILDEMGRVIGITASILGDDPSRPTAGISFAVSIDTIRNHFLD